MDGGGVVASTVCIAHQFQALYIGQCLMSVSDHSARLYTNVHCIANLGMPGKERVDLGVPMAARVATVVPSW